mgnify:CR=1 FL=1
MHDIAPLLQTIRALAREEDVTLTPLPGVWVMRIDRPLPYHRGRNAGMSVAVAASGSKSVSVGGQRLVNDPRRFLVLHGERPYDALVEASASDPYVALKLQLPPDLVARTLIELTEAGHAGAEAARMPEPAVFCGDVTGDLAAALLRLLQCLDDPADREMLAPACLREICYRLLRCEAAGILRTSVTRQDSRLVAAMRFIEANAMRQLTIVEIAAQAAMSPSHFAHRFRAFLGVSPMRYRKQLRLEQARLLLIDTTATVSMAADAAGYASDAHFTRDFREVFGLSPRAYARHMQALTSRPGRS